MSNTDRNDLIGETGKRPRYDEYQDSGVDWLGKLPAHWSTAKIRHLFQVHNGSTPASTEDEYWKGDIVWVTPEDLGNYERGVIDDSSRHITAEGLANCGATIVPEGSIVLSTRAPIGLLGVAGVDLCTNQGCRALEFQFGDDTRFFYYQLLAAKQELKSWGQGSTFQELSSEELRAVRIARPPLEEQRSIATYLDRETDRIDALIENKEQLIDLLEEKRTALISCVVTQGLDSDVEMQASGIEPIGHVPSHWRIKRNKWLYREAEERSETGNEELLTVSHKTGITPRSEKEDVNMIEAESTEGYKICRPGDLVVNTMWAWKGALGISEYHGVVSPSYNVYRLRPGEQERIEPKFLDYLYRIPAYVTEIDRHSVGVWKSRLRLYPEAFFRMATPLPPLAEQKRIVRELDKEMERWDSLREKVEQAIKRLKEYRASLITAAVTGQIDTREGARKQEIRQADTWDRMVLTMELIRRMRAAQHESLGRTLLVKMLYLIQHHVRVTGMGFNYKRKDFGPYASELRYEVENALQNQGWIQVSEGSEQVRYELRDKADSDTVQSYFQGSWGDVEEQIDEIVSYFHHFDAERAEIVATVYAAWNDLKIFGRPHDEDAIIREVRENWHPRKREIEESRWRTALRWMKDEGLVPTGFGEPTVED